MIFEGCKSKRVNTMAASEELWAMHDEDHFPGFDFSI